MAQEYRKTHEYETEAGEVEAKDRGLFDLMGRKEEEKPIEKIQEEAILSQFEKVQVDEVDKPKWEKEKDYEEKEERKEENGEKKDSVVRKLQRSDSSSSSSSDEEEEGEGEGKKKKKKGLKEKIKEKITGDENEEVKKEEYDATATIPEEKCHEVELDCSETVQPAGKKGFLEKIKEKLPGQKRNEEPHPAPAPADCGAAETITHEGEAKEKKGLFDKIKEKLPGYNSKTEQVKEKEQSA